jgi:MFS family permease
MLAVAGAVGAGWAFCFGLGAPLVSLWLRDAGRDADAIGLNHSIYYLGIALASAATPWLSRRLGRACIPLGISVDAAATMLFPWGGGPVGWFALRFLGGAATAVCLIPLETLVNRYAPANRRARVFGVYAVCIAVGVGLGAAAGPPLYALSPVAAFAVGAAVAAAAAALAWARLPSADAPCDGAARGPLALRWSAFSFAASWVQGFLEGGMIAFLALYLSALGYNESGVGGLTGVMFVGVASFLAPSAWLADRVGRARVLMSCLALLLAGLTCLPFCTGPVAVGGWLFVLGGCCASLYPLGLARLGERTSPGRLARANAWYLACNCAGSLTGPAVMGAVIHVTGRPAAMFAVGAAAAALAAVAWFLEGRNRTFAGARGVPGLEREAA